MKRCFATLGFTRVPTTRYEITQHFYQKMEKHKDSRVHDRECREILREAYNEALKELSVEERSK